MMRNHRSEGVGVGVGGGGSEVQDGEWCEHFIKSTIVQLVNETNEDVC